MNNELPEDIQQHLRSMLARLPDAPVASNFTARVMRAVELEEMRRSRWHILYWNWRGFLPRATATAAVVGFAAIAFHQHELSNRRIALGNLAHHATLVAAQTVPSMDALKNFDAIQRMSQTAHPDEELLALASDMQ